MRLLTWNVHGGVGLDRRRDLERVARGIRACRPEVMALQEVDSRGLGRDAVDPFAFLRQAVGEHFAEARTLSAADGHYGQILASRWPIRHQQLHDISVPGFEPRRLIDCTIASPLGALRVLALHFGLNRRERGQQLQRLRGLIRDSSGESLVVMGDFNEWQPRGPIWRTLRGLGLGSTRTRSFPSRLPLFALDRIWVRPAAWLRRVDALEVDPRSSDHRPVYADLSAD